MLALHCLRYWRCICCYCCCFCYFCCYCCACLKLARILRSRRQQLLNLQNAWKFVTWKFWFCFHILFFVFFGILFLFHWFSLLLILYILFQLRMEQFTHWSCKIDKHNKRKCASAFTSHNWLNECVCEWHNRRKTTAIIWLWDSDRKSQTLFHEFDMWAYLTHPKKIRLQFNDIYIYIYDRHIAQLYK